MNISGDETYLQEHQGLKITVHDNKNPSNGYRSYYSAIDKGICFSV